MTYSRIFSNILFFSTLIFSQVFQPPVPQVITSDFGPRMLNGAYAFHDGIDYGAPKWTSVTAVEEGNIEYINSSIDGNKAGWRIRIDGDSAIWTYMHLFFDAESPLSQDNQYEAKAVTLVNPNNPQVTTRQNAIIFWNDRNANIADKILVPNNNIGIAYWWVKSYPTDPGYDKLDPYIKDLSGRHAQTQDYVAINEIIAPSGESGSAVGHPHLHVAAYRTTPYDINPLYLIQHSPDNHPTTTIERPPNNHVFTTQELASDYAIKVLVNSTSGKDLDKVDMSICIDNAQNEQMHIGPTPTFRYGGRPDEDKSYTILSSTGTNTGVQPVGSDPGTDRFVFLANIGSKKLPSGEYLLVVKMTDVNGHETEATGRFVIRNEGLFSVTVSPIKNSVKKGDSASHKITIKNLDPYNDATFDVQLNPSGVGWELLPKAVFLNVPAADGWPVHSCEIKKYPCGTAITGSVEKSSITTTPLAMLMN